MNHPFARLIGLEISDARNGRSECFLVTDPTRHYNPHGVVHGAVLYAMADTGMGAALYTLLRPHQTCATIEIKFNYFRSVREGTVVCKTEIIHVGRSLANLESRLYLNDELIATANGSYAIRER